MAQFCLGPKRLLHQQLHHQSASCDGQVAGDAAAAEQTDRVALLRCWLRAALDSHCRSAFADLTQQLGACSAFDTLALGACDAVCTHSGTLMAHFSVTASEDIRLHHAPLKMHTFKHNYSRLLVPIRARSSLQLLSAHLINQWSSCVSMLQGQLRGDGSGQLRGRAVRQALTALVAHASWRPCVPDLLADLDEVTLISGWSFA